MAKKYQNISKKGDYTIDDLDCALEALVEAGEIVKDAELMKLLKAHAKKKEKQVKSVQDIRRLRDALDGKEED